MRRAAERVQVSVTTAARWASRYCEHGESGMQDRSSRPPQLPGRTCTRTERRIIALRVNRRWGPALIGYLLGLRPSTAHKVLFRIGRSRLAWQDRATWKRNKTKAPANRRPGYAHLRIAVDDHSRLAYTEILEDEKNETAAGFWERANAYPGWLVKKVKYPTLRFRQASDSPVFAGFDLVGAWPGVVPGGVDMFPSQG